MEARRGMLDSKTLRKEGRTKHFHLANFIDDEKMGVVFDLEKPS